MKISDPKIEATKGGQYKPSEEERQRLLDMAKRGGVRINVRDNTPKKAVKKSASKGHGNE